MDEEGSSDRFSWLGHVAQWQAAAAAAPPVRWKNLELLRERLRRDDRPLLMQTSDGRTMDQVAAEARQRSRAVTDAVRDMMEGARTTVLDSGVVVCVLANGRVMLGFDGCMAPSPAAASAPGADADQASRRAEGEP